MLSIYIVYLGACIKHSQWNQGPMSKTLYLKVSEHWKNCKIFLSISS